MEPLNTAHEGFVVLAPGTIASDFSLQSLNKALGQAQDEFLPAVKAEENKYVGYKYVALEQIIAAVRPALTKWHLAVSQFPVTNLEDKTISVYTRLVHWDSGEWMQNELVVPAELALGKDGAPKFNQQTIGGSQTYAQKYAYKAILGVPDSEELIDSTEEKGDLPSRKRVTPASVMGTHTQKPAGSPDGFQMLPGSTKRVGTDGLIATVKKVEDVPGREATATSKAVNPYLKVHFLSPYREGCWHASCFDVKFWDCLSESVGLQCELQIAEKESGGKTYLNILDVRMIAGEEYVNGKPILPEGERQ